MKRKLASLAVLLLVIGNACSSISATPLAVQNDSEAIIYYYIALPGEDVSPQGSVTILPGELFLSPAKSNEIISTDIEADLRKALEAMIVDSHNNQLIGQVRITNISFSNGNTEIALQGDVYAAGDIILIAVRMMLLMTVFSEKAIDTARITLNEQNIANLGVSYSGDAKTEDYIYTRNEINQFIIDNAYISTE